MKNTLIDFDTESFVLKEKRDLRKCELGNHMPRNPFLSLEMSEKFDAKMTNMRQLKSGSSETDVSKSTISCQCGVCFMCMNIYRKKVGRL